MNAFIRKLDVLVISIFLLPTVVYAWSDDPMINDLVCNASGEQSSVKILDDGQGGVFIV